MPPISAPLTAAERSLKGRPWWINAGDWPDWLKVERVIEGYGRRSGGRVRFVGCLAIQDVDGSWINAEYPVFWQEKLLDPSHSHYFAMYRGYDGGAVMITGAQSVADHTWVGGMHPTTGEIIFSRSRWDYRKSRDEMFSVDGGPDGRGSVFGPRIPVSLKVIDGIFRVHEVHWLPNGNLQ
jgi:hypothetical protein